jgi:hypothetical protein
VDYLSLTLCVNYMFLSFLLFSREVLPDFFFTICLYFFSYVVEVSVGRDFGNIHCVGAMGCYNWYQRNRL